MWNRSSRLKMMSSEEERDEIEVEDRWRKGRELESCRLGKL